MYLAYYKLSAKPFQIDTDPSFLWLGSDHREALANLKYGLLESNGYVVLIGFAGTGKTTLVNTLLQSLDHQVLVANVNYPSLDGMEFLSLVARMYDPTAHVATKADCLLFFKSFLQRAHAAGKRVLLVIDEAHRLSEELLEEIRLLSNMEHDGETLINIFFVGQTELKPRLLSAHCKALFQRITLFYHLKPLSEEATLQYIAHRLKVAGCEIQPFTPRAVHAVYKFSRGYPRLINKLCDRALLTGYVKERPAIDASIINECAREIILINHPMADIMSSIRRLLHVPEKWRRRLRFMPALSREGSRITAAFKRLGKAAKSKTAKFWAAAKLQVREGYAVTLAFIQEKPGRITRISASVAALLTAAVLVVGLMQYQDGTVSNQTVANSEEAYRPASYAHSTSLSAQSAPAPSSPTNSPSVSKTAATTKPADPSVEDKAAAMLVRGDYLSVIQLLETNGDPAAGTHPAIAALYAKALVGRAAQLKGQSPQEAETLLLKAVQAVPRNVDTLASLGNLYTRTKAYGEAIDTYQKALNLDPRRTDVLFNLGYIFAATGMYTSSEEMLSRVVKLKPDYADKALFNLAVVQQKLGKRQESLASLEEAVAIQPDNRQAQAYLKELQAARQN